MNNQIRKKIKKIINNPKSIVFEDLDKVLTEFGYTCKQSGKGSSHYIYRKSGSLPFTVPKDKPVKEIYVKKVIELLNLEEWLNGEF